MKNLNIKRIIRHILDSILLNRGFQLVKINEYRNNLVFLRNVFIEQDKCKNQKKRIDSIVFSRDRAMQLHAFLVSFKKMVTGYGKVFIIYKATSERHNRSYNDLKKIFKDEDFEFIKEANFKKQLIDICEKSFSKTIGLYVDDMIFLRSVDYNIIENVDTFNYIVSLSRGKDLVYSQVLNMKLTLPDFTNMNNGLYRFNWDFSSEVSDWTYPLGVAGYFYDRIEFVVMLRSIDFKAPNSLEGNLQTYMPHYKSRFGLCMETTVCVPINANIVQAEWLNPIIGTFSVEELMEKWENGLCINTEKFYFKEGKFAQYQKYEFIKR
ncbi:MAG: hypothetical protein H8D45_00335 [Bacteroidetes bacterium]|nr:hypothetical protein [Bacteroidota bacterium]